MWLTMIRHLTHGPRIKPMVYKANTTAEGQLVIISSDAFSYELLSCLKSFFPEMFCYITMCWYFLRSLYQNISKYRDVLLAFVGRICSLISARIWVIMSPPPPVPNPIRELQVSLWFSLFASMPIVALAQGRWLLKTFSPSLLQQVYKEVWEPISGFHELRPTDWDFAVLLVSYQWV